MGWGPPTCANPLCYILLSTFVAGVDSIAAEEIPSALCCILFLSAQLSIYLEDQSHLFMVWIPVQSLLSALLLVDLLVNER